ncbi:hypothetical protein QQ045_022867 [Rhodiola kirilowii]
MSFISVVSLANTGLSEIRGKHLQYSKFWNANLAKSSPLAGIKLSGRAAMALLYAPAMVAALASFVIYPDKDVRYLDYVSEGSLGSLHSEVQQPCGFGICTSYFPQLLPFYSNCNLLVQFWQRKQEGMESVKLKWLAKKKTS